MFDNPFPASQARILYVHQNVYVKGPDGAVYAEAQFDMRYWSTYLRQFAHVTVAAHCRQANERDDFDRLNRLEHDNLSFLFAPKLTRLSSFFDDRRQAVRLLTPSLAEGNLLILRTYSELGWLAYRISRGRKLPFALELAGCPFDNTWNHGHPLSRLAAPLRFLRTRQLARKARGVLYVTRDFLPKRYPASGITAVASNVRLPEPDDNVLAQRLRKPIGPVVHAGLIGALDHKLKGIPVAIRALATAQKESGRPIVLHLLGPGDPSSMIALGRDLGLSVEADGLRPGGAAVHAWLDGLDIYLQPSFHEGLPRATLEAMSRGLPVFSSSAGGLPEIIPLSNLHKPGDDATLARQLGVFLAAGEPERTRQAAANFDRARAFAPSVLEPIRQAFWRNVTEVSV